MAGNKLIDMAVTTSTFGAELITSANSAAARALLEVSSGGGGGEVASVNGQVGAVVLDYEDVGAASAAQGAKADTALQPGEAPGAITSVNGKTGIVVLTAADVGAATTTQGAKADTALQPGDIPAAPVTSVNGKSGAVTLVPADLGAATSAQGSKADTAVQPSALASVATTGSYNSLTNLPTLGTAASQSSASFATAAQGAKADSAVQPAAMTSAIAASAATLTPAPGAWTTMSLLNGYTNLGSGYGTAQYRIWNGRVEFLGVIALASGNPINAGTAPFFILPSGMRPANRKILLTIGQFIGITPTTEVARVDVLQTGEMFVQNITPGTGTPSSMSYLILDGAYIDL